MLIVIGRIKNDYTCLCMLLILPLNDELCVLFPGYVTWIVSTDPNNLQLYSLLVLLVIRARSWGENTAVKYEFQEKNPSRQCNFSLPSKPSLSFYYLTVKMRWKKRIEFFFVYVFLSSISSSLNRFSAMPGNDNDPDRKPWWV